MRRWGMYKYTVSQGRDSDISKIACNTVFYVCFQAGLFVAASFCLFWCIVKVETQNLASPELALRDMAVHMYANESVYK